MIKSVKTLFHFESALLNKDTFRVVSFVGEEAISQPYRFDIELVSSDPNINLDSLLAKSASLTMLRDDDTRNIHGVISEFEQGRELPHQLYTYRAVLVPRLWLLTLSCQNQIYQNKSVPTIIKEELLEANLKGSDRTSRAGITSDYFEIIMRDVRSDGENRKYFREYVVQYQESDLDFISRLMEHEGIFYFFEQGDESEKLIITDMNERFPSCTADGYIDYQTPTGMLAHNLPTVQQINCKRKQLSQQVVLKDYNYRNPDALGDEKKPVFNLQAPKNIYDNGIGLISQYGDHFKGEFDGNHYAKVRAEEQYCQQHTYHGESDAIQFGPGYIFMLDGHYRQDFNRNFILTRVSHVGQDPNLKIKGTETEKQKEEQEQTTYRNTFYCQPADVPFRPERSTPKPRLYGIMNARIDAAGSGERAEIDDEGRYKVMMPFDASGAEKGQASRYIRMATPYGGTEEGMHFPLRKGTEVIWTCIDGDPDRPIIIGTVPNASQKSVVNAKNSTSNVIRTPSGIQMEFNDGL
ncbi:MAG: type VI secretion system tip protein VgrG [Gammaproteobacteria bacterium]|nr:type VI secretion system tip protein VgrG [Gammaproteobacteria bacterium]